MAYVELHGSLPGHHKTAWLMKALKIKRREAVGIRCSLMAWVIENRPSGYVEADLLAFATDCVGDFDNIAKVLLDCKLVDTTEDEKLLYIHDWPEYTRGYRKARRDAARIKRKRRATVARLSSEKSAKKAVTGADPELTGADRSGGEEAATPPTPTPLASKPPDTIRDDGGFAYLLSVAKTLSINAREDDLRRHFKSWTAQGLMQGDIEKLMTDNPGKSPFILNKIVESRTPIGPSKRIITQEMRQHGYTDSKTGEWIPPIRRVGGDGRSMER